MTPATAAAVTAAVIAAYAAARIAAMLAQRRMRQELHQTHAQIRFLEQELEIAVSISKRLNEALALRFAAAYAPEISENRQPETADKHALPDTPEPYNRRRSHISGNTVYFYR